MIATILPAAAYPLEIVQAARFVADTNNLAKLDAQPWDENVKAVAAVPAAIQKLNDDLPWTISLGEAFIAQPKELMDTIQSLRAKAQSLGTLKTTPQQVVIVTNYVVVQTNITQVVMVTNQVVQIQSANPQVIYVPAYDPWYVYYPPPVYYVGPPPVVTSRSVSRWVSLSPTIATGMAAAFMWGITVRWSGAVAAITIAMWTLTSTAT